MGNNRKRDHAAAREACCGPAIIERGAAAAALFVTLEHEVDEIEAGYEATFGPLIKSGERLPPIRFFLQLYVRLLAALRSLLVVTDRGNAERLADLAAARAAAGELRVAHRQVERLERRVAASRAARREAISAFDCVHRGGLLLLRGLCLLVGCRRVAARLRRRRRRSTQPAAGEAEEVEAAGAEEGG